MLCKHQDGLGPPGIGVRQGGAVVVPEGSVGTWVCPALACAAMLNALQ